MFASRQRLRHWAARVLLVWLFALGTGVVSACIVEPQSRQAELGTAYGQGDHGGDRPGRHAHAPGALGHDHQGHKTPCAKFCDEPSVNVQPSNPQGDAFNPTCLPAMLSPAFVPAIDLTPVPASRAVHERGRATVPVTIAFLRLTL